MRELTSALCLTILSLLLPACGGESTGTTSTTGTNTGGDTMSGGGGSGGSATGGGGSGGSATGGGGSGGSATGGGGSGGSATGGGGAGGEGGTGGMGGAGGTGGTGGGGGMGGGWPTCDTEPAGVPVRTIHEIWQEDPAMATEAWVPGVFVTAVSGGACAAGVPCQLFVQQQETFASIAAGSQQALRVTVLPEASQYFTGIGVGDQVNLRAYVYRHTTGGQNELHFHVSNALPGCAKVVGTGQLVPVPGLGLADLTLDVYEQTMGPLFIRLETVSGKPKLPAETFGLWESFMPGMGSIEEVTSMSPFFVPGSQFTGLTQGVIQNFAHVDGVFGIFAPPADPLIKYEEIYIRSMDDVAPAAP